jgi:hypothetical protein
MTSIQLVVPARQDVKIKKSNVRVAELQTEFFTTNNLISSYAALATTSCQNGGELQMAVIELRKKGGKRESEKSVEEYLRDEVKKQGGKAYKFVSPGNNGVPDRIIFMPNGRMFLVELKATGEKPSGQQSYQHKIMTGLGFQVFLIDHKAGVDEFIKGMIKG